MTFLVEEVTFFVLSDSSDFWLVRCQCNPKALVSAREQQELHFIEFMCEKLDWHVYVDPNILSTTITTFLTLGNRCEAPVPRLWMIAYQQVWVRISPHKWKGPLRLLWRKNPWEWVSSKAHHLYGRSKYIQLISKVLFQPCNEICHHISDLCGWCNAFA